MYCSRSQGLSDSASVQSSSNGIFCNNTHQSEVQTDNSFSDILAVTMFLFSIAPLNFETKSHDDPDNRLPTIIFSFKTRPPLLKIEGA
jgi:hypothetical protein